MPNIPFPGMNINPITLETTALEVKFNIILSTYMNFLPTSFCTDKASSLTITAFKVLSILDSKIFVIVATSVSMPSLKKPITKSL